MGATPAMPEAPPFSGLEPAYALLEHRSSGRKSRFIGRRSGPRRDAPLPSERRSKKTFPVARGARFDCGPSDGRCGSSVRVTCVVDTIRFKRIDPSIIA